MICNQGDEKLQLRLSSELRKRLDYAADKMTAGNRSELIRVLIDRIFEDVCLEETEEIFLAA